MAGLYIHIPFCKKACHYCDFHFSTQLESREAMVLAIADELRLRKDYLAGAPLETIYWGGGTPSLLESNELQVINDAIRQHYVIASDAEITLEANPDDLNTEKLISLRRQGINRLSIGIQSFDDVVLTYLNRVHNTNDALRSFRDARAMGFDNISIDLMYALPGQSLEAWKKNIEHALALSPEHLSAYALTVEEKTTFGHWQRSGKLQLVAEEPAADQFELLMGMLNAAGYEHYEISNFCKPGKYAKHNSSYWRQETYLGVGPGAHSYDLVSRQFNVPHNQRYLKAIQAGEILSERETLRPENKINEYIFTTLRTQWGCDLEKLRQDFHVDLQKENRTYLADLKNKKLITLENNILMLTQTGKLLADKISSDLFVDTGVES